MSSYSEENAAGGESWLDACSEIETGFFQHFVALGYGIYPEEPLLPKSDSSLLFTNSFIVGLKSMIRNGAIGTDERIVMRQACLRTQNLNRHALDMSPLAYGSRFEMIGGLVGTAVLDALLRNLFTFFGRLSGVTHRLRLKASVETPFFTAASRGTEWEAISEIDGEPARYYHWTYGEPGLSGRGVTLALVSGSDGMTREFGNIVELVYKGRTIGYEFGFGIETFLCRIRDARNPIAVGPLADFPDAWRDPRFDQAKDLLRIAHTLHNLRIPAGKGGVRQIMRKTCRSLADLLEAGMLNEADLMLAFERIGPADSISFLKMLRNQRCLLLQSREAHSV